MKKIIFIISLLTFESSKAYSADCRRVHQLIICTYENQECVYNRSSWDGAITDKIDCFPITKKSK